MISTCAQSTGKVLGTQFSFVNTLWLKIYLLERKKQQQEDKKNRVLLLLYDKKVIGVISPRLVSSSLCIFGWPRACISAISSCHIRSRWDYLTNWWRFRVAPQFIVLIVKLLSLQNSCRGIKPHEPIGVESRVELKFQHYHNHHRQLLPDCPCVCVCVCWQWCLHGNTLRASELREKQTSHRGAVNQSEN